MDRLQDDKLTKFSDPSSFDLFLGESLLVEILSWLPSRAAFRLKLVCKSWSSLISSHYFFTFFNHRRHHPSLPPILHSSSSSSSSACFIFQSKYGPPLPIVCGGYPHPDANLCGFRKLDLSFLPCPAPYHRIEVKASCADLILCAPAISRPISLFYVCNPLTKHWIVLPPAPLFQFSEPRYVDMAIGFLCVPAPCSLCTTHHHQSQCVDNSRYDSVVVQICVSPPISPVKFRLQLFSSQEWKTLVLSSPRPIELVRSSTVLVPYKAMLHMLVSDCILVYDPYNCPENFYRVIDLPIPTDDMKAGAHVQTLGLSQDRLRVTYVWGILLKAPIYYIWELEDYDMGKWSLVHKIHIKRSLLLQDLLDRNLDPKIKDTGFNHNDGSSFYWTNSSGWWAANGIVHSITQQSWPTPVPSLTQDCTIEGRLKKGSIGPNLTTRCSSMSSSASLPAASLPEKQAEQVDRILAGRNDDHGGVIVEMTNEPMDSSLFVTLLRASISQWRQQGKRGVWIKLPIELVNLVEPAVKEGFYYHHAEPNYLMLVHWLPTTASTIPANATHRVGVGAFVMNEKNEVLVVQERSGQFRGSGVWKFPTGVVDEGEDICNAAVREVKEETGIDAKFVEILAFRQSHKSLFEKSDLFFVCMLQPLSFDIRIQEQEIEAAQWIPYEKYASQPFIQKHELFRYIANICSAKIQDKYSGFSAVSTVTSFSQKESYLYLNKKLFP